MFGRDEEYCRVGLRAFLKFCGGGLGFVLSLSVTSKLRR